MNEIEPKLFKILVVGNQSVGKTSVIMRYTSTCVCNMNHHLSTIGTKLFLNIQGVDFQTKTLKIDN